MPSAARCARRAHWCGSSGASVATTTMIEPAPASGSGGASGRRQRRAPRRPARRRWRAGARRPWLAWTSTPTGAVASATTRRRADAALEAVADHAGAAADGALLDRAVARRSSAATTCSARTCIPLMSFSRPSYVSPTTGRCQAPRFARRCHVTSASRTTPTEKVFVIPIGVVSSPDSRTHSSPVSSPFPFRRCGAGEARRAVGSRRQDHGHAGADASPSTIVVWPTLTPATSVIASSGPGSGRRSRSRGRAPSRADDRQHLVALALHQLLRPRLEVQAEQRLRIGRAHVEVPVVRVDRDAVEMRDRLPRAEALLQLLQLRGDVGDRRVDLAGDEVPLAVRREDLATASVPLRRSARASAGTGRRRNRPGRSRGSSSAPRPRRRRPHSPRACGA